MQNNEDEIPKEIEPVPTSWQMVGSFVVGAVIVALMVVFALVFATGLWIWSLLI